MQNMLYELTHTFYDKERHVVPKDPHSWKWDYRSARFSASYLSHTLHLVEGMILQLYEDIEREKRAESLKNDNNSNVAEVDVAREAVAEQLDPKEPVELNQSEKLADIANLSSGAEAKP
jgi:hypothetical protein